MNKNFQEDRSIPCPCPNAANERLCSSLKWVHHESDGELYSGTPLPDGTPVAAYQPQRSGCAVIKDTDGNPHTLVATKP